MFWWIITALAAYFVYLKLIKPMRYWKERNLTHKRPWPIIGNMAPVVFRQRSFVELVQDMYNEFPSKRYNGVYSFTTPQILIRDLDLIKQLTVKDFDHFMNRRNAIDDNVEPLLTKSLASLRGQTWRDMRSTLSPAFTSSKMRFMFTLISECAEEFTKYFQSNVIDTMEVDMKDIFTRFTNDAIATSAFGVKIDSLNDRDNEFFVMGKDVTNFGGLRAIKFFAFTIIPTIMKFFKITLFPKKFSDFFTRIIKETIAVREDKGVIRPDMIHLLLEARRGRLLHEDNTIGVDDGGFAVVEETASGHPQMQKKQLTDDDITAQAMIFFFAGFETTATLMCFMSHELAINPDVQEKLQKEIDETLQKCDGKITYEVLLGMKYLDMVVSEALRKWPPGIGLDRTCVKDYVLQPKLPDEQPLVIQKEMVIFIPVVGIHHDPKYFADPEKFNPERFSEENRSKILPSSYMPFGVGPRSCIASRFALMEAKVLFFHLLSKFDLVPIEKTTIPLVLSRKQITLAPDGGFWLGLRQRKFD